MLSFRPGLINDHRSGFVTSAVIVGAVLALGGCGSSSKASAAHSASASSGSAGSSQSSDSGSSTDTSKICQKLPVADAQTLIKTPLSTAVVDDRLGGCTFVLKGNQVNDNNLTVAFEVGSGATNRYKDDVNGTFSAGGSSVNTGKDEMNTLSGVGDKSIWGSVAGYPEVSAIKGAVYCTVSTADDATQLTIIGGPSNPLPQGTPAQNLQYAQLEGKLCTDLFGLVH